MILILQLNYLLLISFMLLTVIAM